MLDCARDLCGLDDQLAAVASAEECSRGLCPSREDDWQTDCDQHLACHDGGGGAHKQRRLRRCSDAGVAPYCGSRSGTAVNAQAGTSA